MVAAKEKERTIEDEHTLNGTLGKVSLAISCIMLLPACVLAYQAATSSNDCDQIKVDCVAHCKVIWNEIERTYMSQMSGERACYKKCDTEHDACRFKSLLSLIAVIMLYFCATCASGFYMLVVVITGGDPGVGMPPRASSQEPTFTEAESNKRVDASYAFAEKVVRWSTCCVCRGKDSLRQNIIMVLILLNLIDKPRVSLETVEARCLRCDLPFQVDKLWLTCEMSGSKGCCCPKCKFGVLGLL